LQKPISNVDLIKRIEKIMMLNKNPDTNRDFNPYRSLGCN
jgi:hypothetical protein